MTARRVDPLNAFVWLVLPWFCLGVWVAGLMWLSSLVGGGSTLFSIIGCSLASWWFFKAAKKEPMFTRIIGYCVGSFLGFCAVALTGVFA